MSLIRFFCQEGLFLSDEDILDNIQINYGKTTNLKLNCKVLSVAI